MTLSTIRAPRRVSFLKSEEFCGGAFGFGNQCDQQKGYWEYYGSAGVSHLR